VKREKLLRPVRPNVGIEMQYRRKLDHLIQEMAASYTHWVKACYRKNEPVMSMAMDEDRSQWAREVHHETIVDPPDYFTNPKYRNDPDFRNVKRVEHSTDWIAMDATPASQLKMEVNRLARHWNKRFNEASKQLAVYFTLSAQSRSDAALRKILKDGGWSVRFQMTPAMRDIRAATVAENVALIKSIPAQYHTEVSGLVMRAVTAGRDIGFLSEELGKRFVITRRRAAFIARDQSNKMTASFQRARQIEVGLEEGVWLHSMGGKEPRPSHVRQSGKKFSIKDGWPDPALGGKRIWPGTEPNCRCVWRVVVKGFS
jgi:uncharacterized protein with gpF-like domain